jgi:hypothetical protein
MHVEPFSFKAEDPTEPDLHGTKVFLTAVMELAVELAMPHFKKTHTRPPKNLQFKITLDGRPLGGRDQVAVGLVPLFGDFKAQSAASVLPLLLFSGRETKHNLKEALTPLAADMTRVKENGLEIPGVGNFNVNYILCCDMSTLWKVFIEGDAGGDHFCTWCMCTKKCRHQLGNPEWQQLRTDLVCIFPVSLTEIVFCSLHARMRAQMRKIRMRR